MSNDSTANNSRAVIVENFKINWAVKEWKNLGFFTEKYIQDINVHWLKFQPPEDAQFYILGVLYIIIMSVGLFGNGLVVFMFVRCKTLRTSANILVVNLAVSDFFMMVKMPLFVYNAFYRGPALGDFACRVYAFLGGLTGVGSIVTLSAISFDRYYVIKFPLSRKYSKLRIKISLVITWLYAVTFATIPALDIGLGKYQPEGYLISCSFDYLTEDAAERNFILVFFVAAFVVPLCLIAYCYFNIIKVVVVRSWGNGKKEHRNSSKHVKQEDKFRQEVKLAVVVLLVIFLWIFSWAPYAVVALLGIFGQKHLITPLSSMVPALFCKTASALDPYIYAVSHPKFRMELKKMLHLSKDKNTDKKRMSLVKPKIWTLHHRIKNKSSVSTEDSDTFNREKEEFSDVEEDIVEIELKDIVSRHGEKPAVQQEEANLKVYEKKLKRNASFSKMLCLNPTFSNKTSSLRRLTRRWSLNKNNSFRKARQTE